MPSAVCNGIELAYETIGNPADTPLMMVNGLGGQLIDWDSRLLRQLAESGYYLVTFDNRDVGHSQKMSEAKVRIAEILAAIADRRPFATPYDLGDLAADAIGLLDHLGIARSHVLGVSMGG